MRTLLFIVAVSSALVLGGCGGGGDSADGAGGGNPNTPPPANGVSLGSRAVPGYSVQAVRMSPVVAGQPVTIRFTVTPVAGLPLPLSVEGWASSGFDASVAPINATAVASLAAAHQTGATLAEATPSGVYDAVIPLADPLPTACAIWARLRLSDGSVLELGRDDFLLSAAP